MQLIQQKTQISAEESIVGRMEEISAAALVELKRAAVTTFHLLWDDEASRADKLAVMGTLAVSSFTQHARTVQFLLESGVEMDAADYTPPVEYTANQDGTISLD